MSRTKITVGIKEQSSIYIKVFPEQNNVLRRRGIVLSNSIKLQRKTPAEGRRC